MWSLFRNIANNPFALNSVNMFFQSEEYIFARDFVNYVFLHYTGKQNGKSTNMQYRGFINGQFNQTFADAVKALSKQHDSEYNDIFLKIRRTGCVNISSFIRHALYFKRKFLGVFNPEMLLHYCMQLSNLAVHFFRHGNRDADEKVELLLAFDLEAYRMSPGMWNDFHRAAEFYASFHSCTDDDLLVQPPMSEDSLVPDAKSDYENRGVAERCQIITFSRIVTAFNSSVNEKVDQIVPTCPLFNESLETGSNYKGTIPRRKRKRQASSSSTNAGINDRGNTHNSNNLSNNDGPLLDQRLLTSNE